MLGWGFNNKEELMKIFGKLFVMPILVHKTGTTYGDGPDISIYFRKSKMAGTMKTTTWTFIFKTRMRNIQWSFCWRPDVTRYWWRKTSWRHVNHIEKVIDKC